tara:strand:- start:5974 stop:7182 length:1209 start_codon:yes stop_codon:yes gene_type:complete
MANNKFKYVYSDPIGAYSSGGTPYSLYDGDADFKSDIITTTKWVAKRLGFPVMQVEIPSGSIYACFEEAVCEYSQHMNSFNMKNWFWNSYGNDTAVSSSISGSPSTFQPQHKNMGITSMLSENYGEAVGIGGDTNLYSASLTLVSGKQDYNLQSAFSASVASNTALSASVDKRIVIQRVFNNPPAAITKFWDPYVGTYDQRTMLDQFGFASYSPATTMILRPLYYDLLRTQAVESSDYLRKSNYSFQINNNNVKLFPIPANTDAGNKVWFHYYIKDDLNKTTQTYSKDKVSDPSNAPYKFINYYSINSVGRQWIKKYTLALSKELLGIVRSKYQSMPIPNGDVTLDGEALKAEGREEKSLLLDELKEFLDQMTLTEKSRQEQEQAEATQQVLNKAPLEIYIG